MAVDAAYYEDLIRRMKVLSTSQATFLKVFIHSFIHLDCSILLIIKHLQYNVQAFVHWKLTAGVSLVQRSLDLLNTKGSHNDPRVMEIKKAMMELKLNEIEVDVSSTQLMLQDEVSLLRNYVDSSVNKVVGGKQNEYDVPSTVQNGEDKEKIRSLEGEAAKYKALLRDAQNEINILKTSANKAASVPVPPPAPLAPSGPTNEEKELRATVAKLESKIIQLEADVKSKNAAVAAKDEELSRINATVAEKSSGSSVLNEQLTRAKQQIVELESQLVTVKTESSNKLEATIQQLTKESESRVKVRKTK